MSFTIRIISFRAAAVVSDSLSSVNKSFQRQLFPVELEIGVAEASRFFLLAATLHSGGKN